MKIRLKYLALPLVGVVCFALRIMAQDGSVYPCSFEDFDPPEASRLEDIQKNFKEDLEVLEQSWEEDFTMAMLCSCAAAGLPDAEVALGKQIMDMDVEFAKKQARMWFKKAADKNNSAGKYYLSLFYLKGEGGSRLVTEGIRQLTEAASMGEPLAQFELARRYFAGEDLPRNLENARRWADKAQTGGVREARVLIIKIALELNK